MKKCKVIHINDGSASVRENGNFRFVEEFDFTESYLNNLMSEGWEVKHMVPEITPAIQGDGYSFYKSGFTFYLEREEGGGSCAADTGTDTVEEVVDFSEIEFDDDFIADFFCIGRRYCQQLIVDYWTPPCFLFRKKQGGAVEGGCDDVVVLDPSWCGRIPFS